MPHKSPCCFQINKYGLLQLPGERNPNTGIMPEQHALLRETVMRLAPETEQRDLDIVLDALTAVARESRLPIIAV